MCPFVEIVLIMALSHAGFLNSTKIEPSRGSEFVYQYVIFD